MPRTRFTLMIWESFSAFSPTFLVYFTIKKSQEFGIHVKDISNLQVYVGVVLYRLLLTSWESCKGGCWLFRQSPTKISLVFSIRTGVFSTGLDLCKKTRFCLSQLGDMIGEEHNVGCWCARWGAFNYSRLTSKTSERAFILSSYSAWETERRKKKEAYSF